MKPDILVSKCLTVSRTAKNALENAALEVAKASSHGEILNKTSLNGALEVAKASGHV